MLCNQCSARHFYPLVMLPAESSYALSSNMEHRLPPNIATELPPAAAASRTQSASDSQEGSGSGGSSPRRHRPSKLGGKQLLRAVTDATLVDFRLSTHVTDGDPEPAEDGGGAGGSTGVQKRRTSSSERGGLRTAKSVAPLELARQASAAADAAMRALPPLRLAPPPQPPAAAPLNALSGVVLLTPEQFEREVTLLRVLGAGGAGSVHEGSWRGRAVAVKLLHPSRQASPNAAVAFRREVDLMSRIGAHPHVVGVLAACLDPPHMGVVQELAERGSVSAALHDEGLRPQYGALLQLAEDVAAAMAHCHALAPPLVHRDLKAHNVSPSCGARRLCSRRPAPTRAPRLRLTAPLPRSPAPQVLLGADGRARVADFGLAAAKHRTFLTVENGALGTACAMAPEQFAAGRVDEKCDSWAFGCLMWECLTGRQVRSGLLRVWGGGGGGGGGWGGGGWGRGPEGLAACTALTPDRAVAAALGGVQQHHADRHGRGRGKTEAPAAARLPARAGAPAAGVLAPQRGAAARLPRDPGAGAQDEGGGAGGGGRARGGRGARSAAQPRRPGAPAPEQVSSLHA
jgi:hypothetical protein